MKKSLLINNIFLNHKSLCLINEFNFLDCESLETNLLPTDSILRKEKELQNILINKGYILKDNNTNKKIGVIAEKFSHLSNIINTVEGIDIKFIDNFKEDNFDNYNIIITNRIDLEIKNKIISTKKNVVFVLDREIVSTYFYYHLNFIEHKFVNFDTLSLKGFVDLILNARDLEKNFNDKCVTYKLKDYFKIESNGNVSPITEITNSKLTDIHDLLVIKYNLDNIHNFKSIDILNSASKKSNFKQIIKKLYSENPRDIERKLNFLVRFFALNDSVFPDKSKFFLVLQKSIIKNLNSNEFKFDKKDITNFCDISFMPNFSITPTNIEHIAKYKGIKVSDYIYNQNLTDTHKLLSEYAQNFMDQNKPMSDYLSLILYFSKKEYFDNVRNLDLDKLPFGILLLIFLHTRIPNLSNYLTKLYNPNSCNQFLLSILFPSLKRNISLNTEKHHLLIDFFLYRIDNKDWISSPTNISRILFFCKYFGINDFLIFFQELSSEDYFDNLATDYFYKKYLEFAE